MSWLCSCWGGDREASTSRGEVSDIEEQIPLRTCRPDLRVQPAPYRFPATAINTHREHPFTVTNRGNANLVIGQLATVGVNNNQFHVVAGHDRVSGQTLAPQASETVLVRFSPTVTSGLKAASLRIPSNDAGTPTDVQLDSPATLKVIVVISVDWEGLNMRPANIGAMEAFRNHQHYNTIPLTHFISAAYFTRSPGNTWAGLRAQMGRATRNGDEIGLHVHCWRSVVEDAGVVFTGQHAWSNQAQNPSFYNQWGDAGHDNPLTDYTALQVTDILNHSRGILTNRGQLQVSRSFRSGGWVSSPAVKQGIYGAGFRIDSSAVPPGLIQGPLAALLAVWNDIGDPPNQTTQQKQPYQMQDGGGHHLKEVPDNCALADYIDVGDMDDHMQNWALNQPGPVLVQIGFHQETAAELVLYTDDQGTEQADNQAYLPRITGVLDRWRTDGHTWQHLQFCTVEQAAAIFLP